MIRRLLAVCAVAALVVSGCGSDDDSAGDSTEEDTTTSAPVDDAGGDAGDDGTDGHQTEIYDDDGAWICRPDLADDECRDLDVTVVEPDGTTTVEERQPAEDPPIDCFYIYPTVSADEGTLADLEWTPEDNEARTVVAQAAQYARSCRVFAPVYRQVTLGGLGGGASEDDRATAYGDVVDAWRTYLDRWNDGRGVIVIGHSQGTGHLTRLLAEEVDGVEGVADLLVAAHLFGGSVTAPEGETVGGSFSSIPACVEADETGCVVTWSSYPADLPPEPNAIFGAARDGERALCVDPQELLGSDAARTVTPVEAPLIGAIGDVGDISTPFVALPEAVEVSCESTPDHDYLAVGLVFPDDPRPVDGLVDEGLGRTWGLHLVDMNVALDDLVELARLQGEAHAG